MLEKKNPGAWFFSPQNLIPTFGFGADRQKSFLLDVGLEGGSDSEGIPAHVHSALCGVQDNEGEDSVQVFGCVLRPSPGVQVYDDLPVTRCGSVESKLFLQLLL